MKVYWQRLLSAFFMFVLVSVSNGCHFQPSKGKQMILEDDNTQTLVQQWDQGNALVVQGDKYIKQGNKMIKKGKKLMHHGETKIQLGKRMITDGDQMMRASEAPLHQALSSTVVNEQVYKEKEQKHLTHKLRKGSKIIEKGRLSIKNGHALKHTGKKLIEEGKVKVKKGREMKEEGNKIVADTEITFHQAISSARI